MARVRSKALNSSSKVLHALSADVQHATNNTILTVTALASATKATSTVAAWHMQASAPVVETVIHISHQFLNLGTPILAMIDGASRFALGLTDIIFACYYGDYKLKRVGASKTKLLLEGVSEIVKSIPEFYCGLQAWQGVSVNVGSLGQFASINLAFLGLAVTNSLDCLTDFVRLIQHYREDSKTKTQMGNPYGCHNLRKDFTKLMVKGLESAGWWLLACGNPLLGAAFLAVVASYKIYEGSFCKQVIADGNKLGLFVTKKSGDSCSGFAAIPRLAGMGAPSLLANPAFGESRGASSVIRMSR